MSAVLLALFKDNETAEAVRAELVRDGFPTDRVDVTSSLDPGRARLEPASTLHGKLVQYFNTLFSSPDEQPYAERFAERVEKGAAAVTVHPRGSIETGRAGEIFERWGAHELAAHDLAHQAFEQAASSSERTWARNFWIEDTGDAHCIYCRMFPGNVHT